MAQRGKDGICSDAVKRLKRVPNATRLAVVGAIVIALFSICCIGGSQLATDRISIIERDGDEVADKIGSDTSDGSRQVEDEDSGDTIFVDVSGAVSTPSVVEIPSGSRVADAIEAAGGLTPEADVSSLNRAAKVEDGAKVVVPALATGGGQEAGSDAARALDPPAESSVPSLVNINIAGVDELDELPGVGPATAQAIVDDREENGSFSSIEDIMRVSGIGEAKFERMRDLISI